MQDKCPKCGKFQQAEADGYYARTMYADGTEGEVRVFCDETCYVEYRLFRQKELGIPPVHLRNQAE